MVVFHDDRKALMGILDMTWSQAVASMFGSGFGQTYCWGHETDPWLLNHWPNAYEMFDFDDLETGSH